MSSPKTRMLEMEINHRKVSFPLGVTVLRAAELNDIYIPSLCSHKDLSPYGGCRMCVVEIEGMRGYPLSCSTTAEEGMKVLTDTATLREMRKEILQLILSEHPASCLICDESDDCRENQYTIRKVGVTTGCRFCPNDGQCELQNVVEKLGVTDIEYPCYYRGNEVEHFDPFFDRDYNLCILCGRCVRMCQEVRGTGILAFSHRGPQVQIGPAFGRTHIEAGCEFCGACVYVCPTGALAEKASKWDGEPDGFEVSTCPFCAVGCQVELQHKHGVLSKVHPNLDPEVNDGQLCVRGRFSIPETTHHHTRARKPVLKRGNYYRGVTWDEALTEVAGKLAEIDPSDFLMLVSGDLTNESLYVAQKFVRSCLSSNGIDSTARNSLAGGLGLWETLFSLPISIKDIRRADSIIAVGLDTRFYFSIVGIEIRHALKAGAELVVVNARDSNLARYTDLWLQPAPGKEGAVLDAMAKNLGGERRGSAVAAKNAGIDIALFERAVDVLSAGKNLTVVISPTVFNYHSNGELVDALKKLAQRKQTNIIPLYQGANTRGALEMGVLGEILPGMKRTRKKGMSLSDVLGGKVKPKFLYLVGEVPFSERPDCDFIVAQDIYYPPFKVDAFLPAASFAEAEGTITNIEGRVQHVNRVEDLPDGALSGYCRPDWFIFSKLAQRLDRPGFSYRNAKAVLREIGKEVAGFPSTPNRKQRRLAPKNAIPIEKRDNRAFGKGPYLLVAEPAGFRHRGIDLSLKVEGLAELALEEGFRMHPEDLRRLKLRPGDSITISSSGMEITGSAKADHDCPEGAIYYFRRDTFGGPVQTANLERLGGIGGNPLRVSVRKAGAAARSAKRMKAASKK